jgi:hypothetical protein
VRARTGAQGLRRVSKRSIHRTSLDDAEHALDAVTRACLVISGAQTLNGICKEDYAHISERFTWFIPWSTGTPENRVVHRSAHAEMRERCWGIPSAWCRKSS